MSLESQARIWVIVMVLGVIARASQADFNNGRFEQGTLQGWTEEYALYEKWKGPCGELGEPKFSNWTSSPSWTKNAQVVSQFTLPNGTVITPDEGSWMAKIGDLIGDKHATRLQQTIRLFGNDRKWANIHLNWAALMVDANHPCESQPIFIVEVEVRRASHITKLVSFEKLKRIQISSTDATGGDWVFSGYDGTNSATYFKRGAFDIALTESYPSGTEIRVTITVAGCTEKGHGSIAFLDNVRLDGMCDLDCLPGLNQTIADQAPIWIPNAFTPNGDGTNDVWEVKGVTFVRQASCLIYDRWGQLVHTSSFEAPAYEAFSYATIPFWDGRKNGVYVPIGVYIYRLYFKNCVDSKEYVGRVTVVR